MAHADTRVLAAGIERGTFEHLAPVLRRDAVQVDWVETPEAGVDMAGDHRYDVILMDAVPCDLPLEKVVRAFRDSSCRSRGAAILVLAEPDQVDVARALRSRGVNRVMLVTDPPEIICDQMANLLEVAPRVQIRLATNVEAALGTAGRELFCQTVNLSSTGMLIRTQNRPPLGTPVVFKIRLSDTVGTIRDEGEIIALVRRNGDEAWRNNSMLRREPTLPIPLGTTVVVGDLEGYIHFFNAIDGEAVARERLGGKAITSDPFVMANRVYVQSDSGQIGAYVIVDDRPKRSQPDVAEEE